MINSVLNVKNNGEVEEFEKIIRNREKICTVYQPIVSLKDGQIIGYEAFSRGPVRSNLNKPDKLFEAAKRFNKIWELEQLCRTKAIEGAANLDRDKFLFINVNTHIINDKKYKKGITEEFPYNNLSSDKLIIEITEKSSINDYKGFKSALENYVGKGYKVAIDDTGLGYSGFKMIKEVKPQFIKIHMDLIRNLDTDYFKQSYIKCYVRLSQETGIKLIAEGVETKGELRTLIKLGVHAAQGFYIGRPKGMFSDISNEARELILLWNGIKNHRFVHMNLVG